MSLLINRNVFLFLVLFWGILLYIPSFNIEFVNDEIAFIQRCQADSPAKFLALLDQQKFDGLYYRPLGNLVSGVLSYFFKYNYFPYRIFNALLHAVNGMVLFLLLAQLLNGLKERMLISFFGALIFLSFPVNDYAVIWHTDLFDRLLFVTYMLSLFYFLRKNIIVSAFFFLISLLLKEMAFSLPLVIIMTDYIINREKQIKNILIHSFPYIMITVLFILFRLVAFDNNILAAEGIHYQQGYLSIVKNYIIMCGIMVVPLFLREVEGFLLTYTFTVMAVGLILSILFGYYFIRYRRNDRLFIFFLLLILITFLPASRLLMRWYLYLPSAGFAALISYVIFTSTQRLRPPLIISIAIILCYSSYLISRESIWISVARKGRSAIEQLNLDYANELQQSKEIYFTTIPAKVDDIPLFNLAFDHHLKHFVAYDKEYYVISKSMLEQFEDTILIQKSNSRISLIQTKDNYFLPSENNLKNKFQWGKTRNIQFEITEDPARLFFTFSNGKFSLLRNSE